MMKIIGLTGSIGMGKTTAANMLRNIGIPVHCSDDAVHDLMKPGSAAFAPIQNAFPEAINKNDGVIDRSVLGRIIFADPDKKDIIESIVHPLVQESQQKFVRNHKRSGARLVILDIPLLFETGAQSRLDAVICVSAPEHIQRKRVLSRPGMTEEKFERIKAAQMPDAEKRCCADYIVETGIGLAETRRSLEKIVRKILRAPYHPGTYFGPS